MTTQLIVLACLLAVAHARSVADFDISKLAGRIIGGHNAKPGEFPHQVSLQWKWPKFEITELKHLCGGSILNEQWILTAAHCLVLLEAAQKLADPTATFIVKAGKHDLNSTEETEQTVDISNATNFIHDNYDRLPEYIVGPFDIGLIKLPKPLRLNKRVAKIDLPEKDTEPSGKVTLSGWGVIGSDDEYEYPNILQTANLEIIDRVTCNRALRKVNEELGTIVPVDLVDETNVCSGPLTGGKSSCMGDSGSPLISTSINGKTELVGVVSWGIVPCGITGAPSMYARVSYFVDWINTVMEAFN